MKVARSTKKVIAAVKADATAVKHALDIQVTRLSEHAGTKRIAFKLQQVIDRLDEWQKAA